MADATEVKDIVADVNELVDDTVELVGEKVSWILQNPKAAIAIAGSIGALIGATVSYAVAAKILSAKADQRANAEIAEVKSRYTVERVMPEKPPLEELAEQLQAERETEQIIAENGYTNYHRVTPQVDVPAEVSTLVENTPVPPPPMVPVERNIFDSDDAETYFDMEEELARREERPDLPYVITKEEYEEADNENDKIEMVYFDGDVTITDSNDQVVPPATVGEGNLDRFGAGSGDLNIVYIRNDKLGIDIELVKDEGKYVDKVLGLSDERELRHSDRRQARESRRRRE